MACLCVLHRLEGIYRLFAKVQKLFCSSVEGLSCGRELNAISNSEEELYVKEIFDVADLLTEVGLNHVQSFCGARHVRLFSDGHNVSQMAKLQLVIDAHWHTPSSAE